MRILFDTSMLYIDGAGKRGIYYFAPNFLKHFLRSSEATVIQYPITKYAGLKDTAAPRNAHTLLSIHGLRIPQLPRGVWLTANLMVPKGYVDT